MTSLQWFSLIILLTTIIIINQPRHHLDNEHVYSYSFNKNMLDGFDIYYVKNDTYTTQNGFYVNGTGTVRNIN